MTYEELWNDTKTRLERKLYVLNEMREHTGEIDKDRLSGKIEGLKLAIEDMEVSERIYTNK